MKGKIAHLLAILAVFVFVTSANSQTAAANNGTCTMFIDNQAIALNDLQPVVATAAEPSPTNDGGGAKTIVNIAVAGQHGEHIQLGLALTEPVSAGAVGFNVSLNQNATTYALVKGDESNVEITDFIWSRDRKSFMVSLSFDCLMRDAAEGNKEIHLKGRLLRVQVPSTPAVCASN